MIDIIIVEPESPENIGAICRALKNMSFSQLILINPKAKHLSPKCKMMAVHAFDLAEKAIIYNTLTECLKNYDLSIAVSRRTGKWRTIDIDIYDLSGKCSIQKEHTAIVFGRESTGLSREEILSCDINCHIPTNPKCPSLNLAQAVMLVVYELSKTTMKSEKKSIANNFEFNDMMDTIIKTLDRLNFFKRTTSDNTQKLLTRVFKGNGISTPEVKFIKKIFSKIDGMKNK